MDYKRIIRSRDVRLAILRFLRFIPDSTMIKFSYRVKTGRKLNLDNPQRFTEKLQCYKLKYRNPLMIQCVDKYDVRAYIESIGLFDILTQCYGVYDSYDDINFDDLPNRFVLKDTLGSGGNSIVLCLDKSKIDKKQIEKQITKWLEIKPHMKTGGREWPYYSGKNHRVMAEEFISSDNETGGLIDYKFFCFQGKACFLYVISNRQLGNGAEIGIYDRNYQRINARRLDEREQTLSIEKPRTFDSMIEIAEKIARPFPHARVDLYSQNDKVLFGEITFFDGSGYMTFDPDSFDVDAGKLFDTTLFAQKCENERASKNGK